MNKVKRICVREDESNWRFSTKHQEMEWMTQRSEAASVSVHVLSKQGNLGHVKGSAINTAPPSECTIYSVKHQ